MNLLFRNNSMKPEYTQGIGDAAGVCGNPCLGSFRLILGKK